MTIKSIREYIEQLDEISRRDFLKVGAGAAAGIAGDRMLRQQNKNLQVPNDPVAWYLLAYFWGISYLNPYNSTLDKWYNEVTPYLNDAMVKKEAGALDKKLSLAWEKGFEQARMDIENKRSYYKDQEIANYYAERWKSNYDKLVALLTNNP